MLILQLSKMMTLISLPSDSGLSDGSLSAVSNMLQVPNRIEKLVQEKQFYAAVQLHVQSMLMLEREGLQMVGSCSIFSLLLV